MARPRKPKSGRKEPQLFAERAKASAARERAQKPRRSLFWWLFRKLFKLGVYASIALACVLGYAWFTLAQKGLFNIPEREPGIMMLASDGSVLAELGSFYGDETRLENLPDYVPNAIVAIEDRRFRSHYGIDPIGLTRAIYRNAMAGQMMEGGSTITQQLAKNLFLTPERTAWRKLQELVLAIWLERKFTKDEILQLYVNRVYFAGGTNGIARGARVLFNKDPADLSLQEAASLAALLKAPTRYNPSTNPDVAAERARLVLKAMVAQGYIADEEAEAAVNAPAGVKADDYVPAKQYAIDWIREQLPLLAKNYDQSIIIETTIDPILQADSEQSLRKRLQENGKKLKVSQGAMVVMTPGGAVRALVGGRSYKGSQFNRVTKAKRQPGSAFKPFVYVTALEQGYRPDTMTIDEPVQFGNWSPDNYRHKYLGQVTLETAFAQSLNAVAAKLTYDLSPESVDETAHRLGISSELGKDVSIALGTSEVTLLELTSAYAPFANGGEAVQPYVVTRITNRDGEVLYERLGSGLGKVIDESTLGDMNRLFRAVVRQGTAKKAQFGGFDVGGKTGTSQDYRDAWFIGFTSDLVAGVWVGNDDNTPTRNVTGGSLPVAIWTDVMSAAHAGLTPAALPGVSEPGELDMMVAEQPQGPEAEAGNDIIVVEPQPRKKRTLMDLFFGDKKKEQGVY
jgi:penicillin-binding protein 1A